ncbi:uncharacterized protein LOC110433353 [Sorghum bicolor]|uniref:uncharacterized protein LOC110433353 n=1 Tax=Sorghum bicolor TaxID=4558 RepID=UPI00081ADBE3|nr:uncharacterized protein LOC110433353 [Sorghum bicolor]|eukprot:XP_021310937.1 uncharacterized protein LOC110433353 [Sorghum bicolor]
MCDPKARHHPSKHGLKSAVAGRAPPPCLLCLDTWASGSTATSTHKNRYASKWQHCSQALRHEQIQEDHVAALLSVWMFDEAICELRQEDQGAHGGYISHERFL